MHAKLILMIFMVVTLALKAKPAQISDSTLLYEKYDKGNLSHPQRAFTTEATYVGDLCTNMSGGIKTGVVYLGMANLRLGFDTRKAGFWNGGQFFINGALTHGQSPSELLTGDYQVISNMDAGNHIYFHELWYRQTFARFEITFGLQDLNVEFASSKNGSMFLNSSFGIPPVISNNIPSPVFPLTALGITGKTKLSDELMLKGAVYDGCPTPFENNTYNTNWDLCSNDGALSFMEIQWTKQIKNLPFTYKAGFYYHSAWKVTDAETHKVTEVFKNNYGLYFIADQTLWKEAGSDRAISAFAQLALSPPKINNQHYYVGGGVNYVGISKYQPENAMGIAFAYAGFKSTYKRNETIIEAYFKQQICENLFLQPDLQFIIHPAGTDETLPNALVGIMRFSLKF